MWQKCPICEGRGTVNNNGYNMNTVNTCPTCLGKRIISEINGLPPGYVPSGPYKNTDFRDGNMESQDEYFGRK